MEQRNDSIKREELLKQIIAKLDGVRGPDKRGEYIAWCPFHPDGQGKPPHQRSLYFSERGFHCFGCGEEGSLQKLAELLFISADTAEITSLDISILEKAVLFYSQRVPDDILAWLDNRGLTDDSIHKFRLGCASGGLRRYFEEQGVIIEDAKETGLIKENDKDYFYQNLVIPYIQGGKVIGIRGRSHPDSSKKIYFPLPGFESHLFNIDLLRNAKYPILTEGELDAILLCQLGFDGLGIPGSNAFKEEWVSSFERFDVVYICFDADDSGRKGAERTAEMLGEKARIAFLPDGLDVTEFFQTSYTNNDFQDLLSAAKTLLDLRIERADGLSAVEAQREFNALMPYLLDLDAVVFESAREKVCKAFHIRTSVFDDCYEQARNARVNQSKELAETPSQPAFSDEEMEAAKVLLSDPDLLTRFLDNSDQLSCVGEELNKTVLFLAMTSRLLENPISIIVKGESSSGKSHLVQVVTRFFPDGEVLEFTAMSAKSLFHRQDSLAHKVLVVYEYPGTEETDYPIRTMQSEGKLIYAVTVKDDDGNPVTIDKEVEGPISFVETTTNPRIHPENETRSFELFIDESEEQTGRIFSAQNQKYDGTVIDTEKILRPWQALQMLLKPYPVLIPYIKYIKFPKKPTRVRRDRPRFFSLIEASAVLHQAQREMRTIHDVEYIVADCRDYGIAYRLAHKLLAPSLKAITPKAEEIVGVVAELSQFEGEESGQQRVRTAQVVKATGWNNKTCLKYLRDATDAGYLDCQKAKNAFEYEVLRIPQDDEVLLLNPEELEAQIRGESMSSVPERSKMGVEQLTQ